jgi:predicted amidohydrolase
MNRFVRCAALALLLSACSSPDVDGPPENESPRTTPFKVASVTFNPELNNRDDNVAKLAVAVEEAARNGAKLIVTPEMSTTGYYYADRAAIAPFVDTIPGVTTDVLARIADAYDAYIVVGMAEVDPSTRLYYNSAALIGPKGLVKRYRKSHQWETEEHWAAWGDLGIPVYETALGKLAINICMDSAYFETSRLAALGGADILAFPSNSSGQAVQALQARAEQNGLFVVSANRSNTEGEGQSYEFHMVGAAGIWSPAGEKLAEAPYVRSKLEDVDAPTITYAEIDPAQYDNANKRRLKERRPETYKDLTLFIGPWDYTKNTASRDVKAAAIQYAATAGDKDANFTKVTELVAGTSGVNLIVLPELSLTGLVEGRTTAEALAESLSSSPTLAMVTQLATTRSAYVVGGLIEKDGNELFNTAVLVGPTGGLVGKYRKVHLTAAERSWATAGKDFPVFKTELGHIGMLIGYDAAFPEAAGVLTVKRADIIAMPSSWDGSYGSELKFNYDVAAKRYPQGSMSLWDSLAMTAQAYTVVANYVGGSFRGRSGLYTLDPMYGLDQPVVASATGAEVLMGQFKTLALDWWLNQEAIIVSRRTHMDTPLVVEP